MVSNIFIQFDEYFSDELTPPTISELFQPTSNRFFGAPPWARVFPFVGRVAAVGAGLQPQKL